MGVVLDTNVLLDDISVLDKYDDIILPSAVLEEIDGLKKNPDVGFKARETSRQIELRIDKIKFHVKDVYDNIHGFDMSKRDNHIIMSAKENNAKLISNDLNVRIKAGVLGVESEAYSKDDCEYKGWRILQGNCDWINKLHDDLSNGINEHNLLINEYIELINTDFKESDKNYSAEYRFDGYSLVGLKLPPSKVIKGKNIQQRFALDLLNNKDIPIKVVVGTYGSGKTLLAVKMALYHVVEQENYANMTLWRTPVPTDGVDIGFLPGDKQSKIIDYMKPMLQYINKENNPFYLENLLREEKITMDVISFLKGVNVDDSFVIFDECEDLNVKLLKLIGTRIGDKSCIVFTGDYKQAESRYKNNNGILHFIKNAKGNPLVGIVVLEEDIRSEASKVFADLD